MTYPNIPVKGDNRFAKIPGGTVPEAKHPNNVNPPSPQEATDLFAMKVEEIEHAYKCDYQTAFARAKLQNKDLVEAMAAGNKKEKDLVLGNDTPPVPVFGVQTKTMLGLPADADEQECEVAWQATHGVTTPRDNQAIWKMLSALWQGRKADQPRLMVERFMKERFPLLASQVSTTAI
jgi:hypothetical protein